MIPEINTPQGIVDVSTKLLHCCLPFPEQKEKLTEVEQQLKKAEAAERRRMHNEKAARESEVCRVFAL